MTGIDATRPKNAIPREGLAEALNVITQCFSPHCLTCRVGVDAIVCPTRCEQGAPLLFVGLRPGCGVGEYHLFNCLHSISLSSKVFPNDSSNDNIDPTSRARPCPMAAQTPIGKFRLLNGLLFFIALNKANRLEKSQGTMAYPMRLYGSFYAPHKGKQANIFPLPRQSRLRPRVVDVHMHSKAVSGYGCCQAFSCLRRITEPKPGLDQLQFHEPPGPSIVDEIDSRKEKR